jgi:repressor LexA
MYGHPPEGVRAMPEPLAPRQKDVLLFITDYQQRHECAPTVRELCEGLGVTSTNTIDYHLKALERKGYIRRRGNLARSIEVVDRRGGPQQSRGLVRLPVVGEIAAGLPIQALDGSDETLDVALALAGTADAYALRVRGESMIDEHICDGDLVVVRPQQTARNGDIVVALLADNGVTLKKFYHEGDHIRLQPANATMPPIIVPADEECAIQGTVMAVIRPVA